MKSLMKNLIWFNPSYSVVEGDGGGAPAPAAAPATPAPAPAPAPTPAPAAAPAPAAPTGGEGAALKAEEMKELLTDDVEPDVGGEALDVGDETPAPAPKKDETPAPPATPPTPTPEPAPAPTPPPPAATAPEPPAPEPAPAPAAPEPPKPQPTAEELARKRTEDEAKFVGELQKLYAIDDATADKFLTEPQTVVPALAAKLHKEVLAAAVNGIMSEIPRVVEAYHERREASARNEKMFFDSWPQLKTHRGVVSNYLQAYRQANPAADLQTTVRDVGAMVCVALRLPVPGTAAQQPPVPPNAPAAPAATFTPALPGGGSRPVVQPQPKVGMEAFIEEVIADGDS